MVTQDFEGNALRGYRFLKGNSGSTVVGLNDMMRRATTAFDGVELSEFENVRPLDEIFTSVMSNKRGLTLEEFVYQILDQLGLEPKEIDMDEVHEIRKHSNRDRYTEAGEYNMELLKTYATQWSVEQELSDADEVDVELANKEAMNALSAIQRLVDVTNLNTDPEYSYDEQLSVRVNETLELLDSIEQSLHDERVRRKQ